MLSFQKYEGLGNDFILVDRPVSAAEAIALCDRRFGVGADGVLMVLPPEGAADARMRILNADGSEAEMCGNGIRCVAKELYDGGRARKEVVRVETLAGVLSCTISPGPEGRAETVAVEMGRPERLRPSLDEPLAVEGRTFPMTCIGMGNPHAVTFVEGNEALRPLAERYGPFVERHDWFPKRTNVELARVAPGGLEIELVVWERGCGITLACGTGACATAVAATLTGRAPQGREIALRLLGGTLGITVAEGGGGVRMRGPAQLVFSGTADLDAVARTAPQR
jgi:diaminopimelate epimerase